MEVKRLFWVVSFIGLLLVNLVACSGGGGPSGASPVQNTAVLASSTRALDTATIQNISSVSADGAIITFSSTTPLISSLNAGDVVISSPTAAAPKGLLKTIVSTSTNPDGTVQVVTSPATLTDAFQELHLKGTIVSESSVGAAVINAQQEFTAKSFIPKITFSIPNTPFSATGQYESSLSGTYTFNPVLDYVIDISGRTLKEFKLALRGPATFDLDETLTLLGSVNVSPPEKALTAVPVFIATIPTGNPLIFFTLEFIPSIGVTFSAEAVANVSFGFKSSCNITAGIEYRNGDFLPVTSYDYSFDPYFTVDSATNLYVKPYFRSKIGFYINDIAGPYFDLRPYGKFSHAIIPDPHVEYSVGITGNAGGELKFLTLSLASVNAELFNLDYPWIPETGLTIPTAPAGLTATAASSSQIDLSWLAPTGTVSGYKIYKNGAFLKSINTTSAFDANLQPATNYCYYITAYNSAGESVPTEQICTTTSSTGYSYSQIWPVIGGNAQHTGQATSLGPQTANLVMTANVNVKPGTSPVIGMDKTIYAAGTDNKLYAIHPNGSLKWTLALTSTQPDIGMRTPAVSSDGRIYVVNQGSLFGIKPDGSVEWDSKTFLQGSNPIGWLNFSSDVTIDNDVLYVGADNGAFAAVMPDGSEKWSSFTHQISPASIYVAPTVGFNEVFIKDAYGYYGAFYPSSGAQDWWLFYPNDRQTFPSFPLAIGTDGYLYIKALDGHFLYLINYDQQTGNSYIPQESYDLSGGVAISSDGMVYVGNVAGYLYAFSKNSGTLTINWTFLTGGAVRSFPVIGSDGTVYFGADDGKVYAVDRNGNIKWEYATGGSIKTALAIGPDGTLYVGSSSGKLYGFRD